jgi:myo-inositol-1(or 4)-monophosphatase
MDIEYFRRIGKRLRQEIPPLAGSALLNTPLGKGASGDITYPIDKKAEDIILEEMEKLNIPLTIVSEESGLIDFKGGGPILLIDPIDGSKNALSGIPVFSTSIALIDGETLERTSAGYIINLVNGDEFWAVRGKGGFFNGKQMKTREDEGFNVIAYEAQTPGADIPKILPLLSFFRRTRSLGSIALDMSLLARGTISMFISPTPSRSFDFASGYLLINESGGIVTDLKGRDLKNTKAGIEKTTSILASGNSKLHEKALKILST